MAIQKGIKMLKISNKAWQKMQALVQSCSQEIGWFGFVTEKENNLFILEDIYVPKEQSLSAASCTILEEGDNGSIDWEDRCREIYGNGFVRLWGHSHVNMAVSPSGQDVSQFSALKKDLPYYFRLIMNKKNELNIAFSAYGFEITLTSYTIDMPNEYNEWATKSVEEAVKYSNEHRPATTIYNAGVKYGLDRDHKDDRSIYTPSYDYGKKKKKIGAIQTTITSMTIGHELAEEVYDYLVAADPYAVSVYRLSAEDFCDISTYRDLALVASNEIRAAVWSILKKGGFNVGLI